MDLRAGSPGNPEVSLLQLPSYTIALIVFSDLLVCLFVNVLVLKKMFSLWYHSDVRSFIPKQLQRHEESLIGKSTLQCFFGCVLSSTQQNKFILLSHCLLTQLNAISSICPCLP